MELIQKPEGDINVIYEDEDGEKVIALYEFSNNLPSYCSVSFNLKFYFSVDDQYYLEKCEIVQEDQAGFKQPNKLCSEEDFLSSDKIDGGLYDTIGFSSNDIVDKFTNYTIKFTFSKTNSTSYSIKFLSKIESLINGLRFETIVNNKTYDIVSFYSTGGEAPPWAIGVIMLPVFILIVFSIVSCVLVKNRTRYFFKLL
ncbi:hypothetical protein SteCoe_9838 [Stentor coeruleus]|uniref:Uncharacterized protein n=1 Tax=Stentor coeruleus TaxID=5963 RepID=A0A1R2CGV6_9CILI|nr:hypothetical protein SteCoe_9838 [Stentor coeruleus]